MPDLLRLTTATEEAARQGDYFSTWHGLLSLLALAVLVGLWMSETFVYKAVITFWRERMKYASQFTAWVRTSLIGEALFYGLAGLVLLIWFNIWFNIWQLDRQVRELQARQDVVSNFAMASGIVAAQTGIAAQQAQEAMTSTAKPPERRKWVTPRWGARD